MKGLDNAGHQDRWFGSVSRACQRVQLSFPAAGSLADYGRRTLRRLSLDDRRTRQHRQRE